MRQDLAQPPCVHAPSDRQSGAVDGPVPCLDTREAGAIGYEGWCGVQAHAVLAHGGERGARVGKQTQGVVAHRGARTEQDHGDTLQRDRVIPRCQGARFPLEERQCAVTRGKGAASQVQQAGTVLVRNLGAVEAEPPLEHSALRDGALWSVQQKHAVAVCAVAAYTVREQTGESRPVNHSERAMDHGVGAFHALASPRDQVALKSHQPARAAIECGGRRYVLHQPVQIDLGARSTGICHAIAGLGMFAQRFVPKRIHFGALSKRTGGGRQRAAQSPGRPHAEVEAKALAGRPFTGHGFALEAVKCEDVQVLWPGQNLRCLVQRRGVQPRIGVQIAVRMAGRDEESKGTQKTGPKDFVHEMVKCTAFVVDEPTASTAPAPFTRPASEVAKRYSRTDQVSRRHSAGAGESLPSTTRRVPA